MHLKNLRLVNYKNYEELTLDLNPSINAFVGRNGSGKTNILDAVYFLALTKSAFSQPDSQCIRHGQAFAMITGTFASGERALEVSAGIQPGTKKVIRANGTEYEKLSDHIGRIPLVLIAPDDTALVKEGSESRRKFFDGIISQVDNQYLESLLTYSLAVKNRNSLLRMFSEHGKTDFLALEAYDRILVDAGNYIYNKRVSFSREFQPIFQENYGALVGGAETTRIVYNSGLHETEFNEGLRRTRSKDLLLQRTSFGVHRDDFEFLLEHAEMKKFGSQGQQKSFVIALKLAQYQVLKIRKGFRPILLLDDIFDKLDDSRIERLLTLIRQGFGQLFLTDARPHRTDELLKGIGYPVTVFEVENGKVAIKSGTE